MRKYIFSSIFTALLCFSASADELLPRGEVAFGNVWASRPYVNGKDTLLVSGNGSRIFSINTHNFPDCAEISSVGVGYEIRDIVVDSGYAFAVCPQYGLFVLSISNSGVLTKIGQLAMPGSRAVKKNGHLLLIAAGGSGLYVVDVSTPNMPQLHSTMDRPYCIDVCSSDNYAYAVFATRRFNSSTNQTSFADGCISILDISDPDHLVELHQITVSSFKYLSFDVSIASDLGKYTKDCIAIDGKHLCYVSTSPSNGEIYINEVDVTTPVSPVNLNSFTLTSHSSFYSLLFSKDTLDVLSGSSGSTLLNRFLMSTTSGVQCFDTLYHNSLLMQLTRSGNKLWAPSIDRGIGSVDLLDSRDSVVLKHIPISISDVHILQQKAYCGFGYSGYCIYDFSNPDIPVISGQACPGVCNDINILNPGVLIKSGVGGEAGFTFYDIKNPNTPVKIGSLLSGGIEITNSLLNENYLVGNNAAERDVFYYPLSEYPKGIESMQWLQTVSEATSGFQIASSGNTIFQASGQYGLSIYQPFDTSIIKDFGPFRGNSLMRQKVVVSGNMLYTPIDNYSYEVYDMSDLELPALIDTFTVDMPIADFEVMMDKILCSCTDSTIRIYDAKTATELGRIKTSEIYTTLRISEQSVYGITNGKIKMFSYSKGVLHLSPASPKQLTPRSGDTLYTPTPVLKWQKIMDASSYRIQICSLYLNIDRNKWSYKVIKDTSGIIDDSLLLHGLSVNSTGYDWRICSVNTWGQGGYSPQRHFNLGTLAPPVILSPHNGEGQVRLSPKFVWKKSGGVLRYHLQLALDSAFTNLLINDSLVVDTFRIVSNLNQETRYFWKIRSVNTMLKSEWTISSFTTGPALPDAPTLIFPANNNVNIDQNVTLIWNRTGNTAYYHIQMASDTTMTTILFEDTLVRDDQASAGLFAHLTTCYWRVHGVNSEGAGAWSAIWKFTISPSAPSQIIPIAPDDSALMAVDSVIFRWSKALSGDRYNLEIATDSLMTSFVFKDTMLNDTQYVFRGLKNKQIFFWHVRARNITGWGEYSAQRRFRIDIPSTSVLPNKFTFSFPHTLRKGNFFCYALPVTSDVSISITTLQGKKVLSSIYKSQSPGYYQMPIDIQGSGRGLYLIDFRINGFRIKRQLLSY